MKERQLVAGAVQRLPHSAGKPTLSTLLWDKLGSTPCGHHMDSTGGYVFKTMRDEELLLRESHLVFDDYDYATGGPYPLWPLLTQLSRLCSCAFMKGLPGSAS